MVLEGRLVKPDVTSLVGMLKNDLLVILFELLPACDMCKLANLAELITNSTLHAQIVAWVFSLGLGKALGHYQVLRGIGPD